MKLAIVLLLVLLCVAALVRARIPSLDNNNIARADLVNCPEAWSTTAKTSITNQAGKSTLISLDGTSGNGSPNWNRAACCQDWVITPLTGSAIITYTCGCDVWIEGLAYGAGTISANIWAVSLNHTCSLQPVSVGYQYLPTPTISGSTPPANCNAHICQ